MADSITRRRGVRTAKRVVVVLQPRDYDLFTLLALVGYMSTHQAARELFAKRDRALRRFRRLFDAGLIDMHLVHTQRPMLLSLTKGGLAELKLSRPELYRRRVKQGPVSLGGINHHLAVIDLRLYVAALVKQRLGTLEVSSAGGALHQRWHTKQTYHLEPDALVAITLPNHQLHLALEADAGTESRKVLKDKLDRYVPLISDGVVQEIWWLVIAGTGRQQTISMLSKGVGLGPVTRIMETCHVNTRPALAPPSPLNT